VNRRAPLVLALLLPACAPLPPAAPPAPVSAPASPSPPAPASSPLLALVPPTATAVIRIDWKAARASPLYAKLLTEGSKLGLLDPQKPHCVVLPDAVDELVIALTGPQSANALMVVRTHDEAVVRGCMPELEVTSSIIEAPVAGHEAISLTDGMVAVFVNGLFVIGNRSSVELALSPGQRSRALAPITRGLDVSANAVVSFHREGPGFFGAASPVSLVLETNAEHLALRVSGTMPSPEAASALLLQATALRDKVAANSDAAADSDSRAIQGLIASLHLTADGARLHGEIEVKGGADEQGRFALLLAGTVMAAALGRFSPPG
jgi:hypothetical protein